MTGEAAATAGPWKVRMRPRSPHEPHRAATPLELFFDLVFVVAIAQAAEGLHHDVAGAHVSHGLVSYLMVFFGIWWAWMNFTWFASAYDCDDAPYRLSVFVQITGALIFAAGVKQMFADGAINGATLGGYVIMRLAGVTQWLRAAASDPERRTTTRRYAIGVSVCQAAWIGLYFAPPSLALPGFVTFALAELAVPVWAERAAGTPWHPHHIAERYGLFTIIVLGESVLAATLAVQAALESGERLLALAPVIGGGLLIVYALWWLYFYRPVHGLLETHQLMKAVTWGYGHYVVFASAAAVGAGLAVMVDSVTAHAAIGPAGARAAVAVPVALYLLSLWWLHYREGTAAHAVFGLVAVGLILAAPLSSFAIPIIGVILSALLVSKIAGSSHAQAVAKAHVFPDASRVPGVVEEKP
jgi:low temperature requirement protein LtrA